MKQVTQFSVAEYKDHFTELLRQVEKGRRHLITRHGRPIARVAPVTGRDGVSETITRIRANRVGGRRDLKALIHQGRR